MLCLYVDQYKIYKLKLPKFTGSSDEKLRKACCWVSKYCPSRTLTLEQIGQIMDVSRERVRQIEVQALRKLWHPSRMKILKEHQN